MKPSATESASLLATCGLAALLVVASANPASAATTFLGGNLATTANWSNGLPSSTNAGTITVNAYTSNTNPGSAFGTGYQVNIQAGTITSTASTNSFNVQTGTWNMTGGEIICRYFLANKAVTTFNMSGGTITLNGTGAGFIAVNDYGKLNISGSAELDAKLANQPLPTSGTYGNGTIDIASDWTGTWIWGDTPAEATNWEALFTSGHMTFDGNTLDSAGFNSHFKVDGYTLSMIPEPGSLGLVLFSLVSLLGCRRR